MDLESFLTTANASLALREFTFGGEHFSPRPGDTKEFADGVLSLGKKLVIYQVKERAAGSDLSEEKVESWFKRKVEDKATSQIRGTHKYLAEHGEIVLTNARGHAFDLKTGQFDTVHNVVVYGCDSEFPPGWNPRKHHVSQSTGVDLFIHFVEFRSYLLLCETLLTPTELFDYLAFRERYLSEVASSALRSEKWILGRFLMSPEVFEAGLDAPGAPFERAVDNLRDDRDLLSARMFLEGMGDRVAYSMRYGEAGPEGSLEETAYYGVLVAFALLNRSGLRLLGERMTRAIALANKDELRFFRFEIPERSCGYLIAALPRKLRSKRRDFLIRFLQLNKYERRLHACAGVSVCFDADHVEIDWAWVEQPWAQNDALDEVLREEGSPFPEVNEGKILLYDTRI